MRDYNFPIGFTLVAGFTIFLAGYLVYSLIVGNENFTTFVLGVNLLYSAWTLVRIWRYR